jgi:hypothetical protein
LLTARRFAVADARIAVKRSTYPLPAQAALWDLGQFAGARPPCPRLTARELDPGESASALPARNARLPSTDAMGLATGWGE